MSFPTVSFQSALARALAPLRWLGEFRALALMAVAALILLPACSDSPVNADPATPALVAASGQQGGPDRLRLMTRNVYLGGDVGPVLQVDFNDIGAVVGAAATVWASVQANDFPSRAEALADEILENDPHMVGLQEAVRFVTLNGQFQPTGGFDYVQILQSALVARGLSYNVVVQENTDVVLPIAIDLSVGAITEYLKFTDRIALLVRSDVPVSDLAQGNYQAQLPLAPGVILKRGWIRVSSEYGDMPFNLINTHLEVQALAPVQAGQTAELLGAVAAGLDEVTFVMGDLNSDAEAGPGAPSWTPTYNEMIAAGFADVWTRGKADRPGGLTCCHDPNLVNLPGSLDERIDFILVRGAPATPNGNLKGAVNATVVGDQAGDIGAAGLWPSDHAGIAARVRFPAPQLGGS